MPATIMKDCEAVVDIILERVGKRIVCAVPLGIGKPNGLLNAIYRRAQADSSIQLEIITALSLNPPFGKSGLEELFMAPLRKRLWPDYPRLLYLDDLNDKKLPPNVKVLEFYLQPASQLGNPEAQQNYISSNYTSVSRDLMARGVNLLMQSVNVRTIDGTLRVSLSGNTDVTLELIPLMENVTYPWLSIAQVNRRLPWTTNLSEQDADMAHIILDDPTLEHEPFSVPHEPVAALDWAIGLRAGKLVRDGGTLQVGIGALGDAVCHVLRVRERDNAAFNGALKALESASAGQNEPVGVGGTGKFEQGLYVASELISNALYTLFEENIVRRRVYKDVELQQRANAGAPQDTLPTGTAIQGAFFLGPADFYQRLRDLPPERLALIDMTSAKEVNSVYMNFQLEQLQRLHARLINITMKATLLGAAASDQLANGQVVSGVGGQHDFVAMAHQLPDARSILMLRATRGVGPKLKSNIVWEYPHATIPRHERDIFVTEYGVADLRGKSDAECCAAMIAIADSRFQEGLLKEAQAAGKLPATYQIPQAHRNNFPDRVADSLKPFMASGALPELPFGCDLNADELQLAGRLQNLKVLAVTWEGRRKLIGAMFNPAPKDQPDVAKALRYLQLDAPTTKKQGLYSRLVRAAYVL